MICSPVSTWWSWGANRLVVDLTIWISSAGEGIVEPEIEHEPVELCFGKRVGSFLLDGILRGEHEERFLQRIRLSGGGHAMLLHRLEQRRLRLRRRAVDLVGQDDVGEHRALDELEGLGAARARFLR